MKDCFETLPVDGAFGNTFFVIFFDGEDLVLSLDLRPFLPYLGLVGEDATIHLFPSVPLNGDFSDFSSGEVECRFFCFF